MADGLMGFFVYIDECYINRKFSCYYTGQTNNLQRRRAEHIQNVIDHKTKHFTGRFEYVKMIWFREVPTREDALRLESYLKNLSPDEKEEYMEENGKFIENETSDDGEDFDEEENDEF